MSTRNSVACQLRHLTPYKVLLCVTCGYCVQPQALDRHLKTIHRISGSVRKKHLDVASQLHLAAWDEVVYPSPKAPPVTGLPILSGHSCNAAGCEHLCVTAKRMQAHWAEKHSELAHVAGDIRSRPVRLQTFFRGSGLRYFEVVNRVEYQPITPDSLPETKPSPLLTKSSVIERSEDTTMDWLLAKDFQDYSWSTVLPCESTKSSWRDQMLQDSARVDVLRYAMLSVTASRVAFDYPEARALYTHEAESHHNAKERNNFFAYFNLQRLMTICYVSSAQSQQAREHGRAKVLRTISNDGDIVPAWILVQRKGRAIIWQHCGQGRILKAIHGPGRLLYDSVYCMPEIFVSLNPHDNRLRALEAALYYLPSDTETDGSCTEALSMLRRAWENVYRQQAITSFRDMALMWTARVPERFLKLLQDYDVRAMVIFAHYCVLWSLSEEQCWYAKGQAATMLCTIVRYFPQELHKWIDWPKRMVFGCTTNSQERWN